MNFVRDDWTLVVAGAWNVGIFQPPWVSTNVFHGQNMNMEMQLGSASPVLRYHHGRVSLIVQPDLLVASLREETTEATVDAVNMLCAILVLLPHTPVTGLGINFGFREQHPSPDLVQNFSIEDTPAIVAAGAVIGQTSIHRELTLAGRTLHLRETFEDTGAVHFHLNFHHDVQNSAAALDILRDNAAQKREQALAFMLEVYGLDGDQNDGE